MVVLYSMYKQRTQKKVLGETVVSVQTPSPTETPTSTPTIKPTPTITPTPTPIPQPEFSSEQIYGFIEKYASQYGVSPDILRRIAYCESDFKPDATSIGYAGLFQFGPITWKDIRMKMSEIADIDLRFNAKEAVKTASFVLQQNKAYIWPNCAP